MKERSAIIRSYEMVVLVFGFITFGLVVALFSQIIRPWYLGALLGLGVSSVFGLIIFLGLRQHRVRRLIPKTTSPEESELEFLVTESPYGGMVSKKLKLSPQGIMLPIELMTRNVYRKCLREQQSEFFLAWEQILSWKIHAGSGSSMSQHSLELTADSSILLIPQLGILRTKELRQFEEQLVKFASAFLQNPIEVCTDDFTDSHPE